MTNQNCSIDSQLKYQAKQQSLNNFWPNQIVTNEQQNPDSNNTAQFLNSQMLNDNQVNQSQM
jgi:hypothetical protein